MRAMLALLLLGGLTTPLHAGQQMDTTFTVELGGQLMIDNHQGAVHIRSWDRAAMRVVAKHVPRIRNREFGIRMALGARRGDVLRLVLARGAVLAVAGAVIGLVLASGLTRAVRSFLFGVSPLDPISYAAVASLLIGVALAASYVPARRATAADLLAVLRQE